MRKYVIPKYEDYELHYSDEVQLVWSKRNEKYLKLIKDRDGYLQVSLYRNKKERTFKIHQIVWLCIKGDIPKGLEINHRDEVKTNNSIENLELVTRKENNNYGTRTERTQKPIVGIKKDLSEILNYPSTMEAQRIRGFHIGNISQCCLNKRKSHKDFIWFFKSDFDSYMDRFNNNLEDVINFKLSLHQ